MNRETAHEDVAYLEYNTQREYMIIPEYGRNIQKMVNHAITIENRELRNKVAQSIITVMGQLNPHLRDFTDFTHKLWDHLFIISDFKLDVDSPYPKPSRETFDVKPEKIKYPAKDIKYMHYGRNVELLIEKAISMEEGAEKNALVEAIANLMKRFYFTWNKETVSDEVIFKHLRQMSQGKLNLDNIKITTVIDYSQRPQQPMGAGKKKKKMGGHKPGQAGQQGGQQGMQRRKKF
jgi:hypothetical protein